MKHYENSAGHNNTSSTNDFYHDHKYGDIFYHGTNGTKIVDSTRNIMPTLFLITLRNIMLLYAFGVSLSNIRKLELDKQQPTPWRLLLHHFIFIVIMMIMIIISFQ